MYQNKRRIFNLGALFLLMGLFFVLLTGCVDTSPVKKDEVKLAYEQTQLGFAEGDSESHVTQDFVANKLSQELLLCGFHRMKMSLNSSKVKVW